MRISVSRYRFLSLPAAAGPSREENRLQTGGGRSVTCVLSLDHALISRRGSSEGLLVTHATCFPSISLMRQVTALELEKEDLVRSHQLVHRERLLNHRMPSSRRSPGCACGDAGRIKVAQAAVCQPAVLEDMHVGVGALGQAVAAGGDGLVAAPPPRRGWLARLPAAG